MRKEPFFLTLAEVLEIHSDQIHRYGGHPRVRELTLVISAVAMPQQTFGGKFLHEDLFQMAAAYAYHISENQPFIDGNKRTGLAAALAFLEMNGIPLSDPQEKLLQAMKQVSRRHLDKQGLAKVFSNLVEKTV